MDFIYGIICHKMSVPLAYTVKKLCKSKDNFIIIHVDSKLDQKEFNRILTEFLPYENVIFTDRRINVRWGSISQIQVMLYLLEKANTFKFKYFSLISGDDIPILSNADLLDFLNRAYLLKKEFIGAEPTNISYYNRINIKYPELMFCKNRNLYRKIYCKIINTYNRIFNKVNLSDFPPVYKGASWFTITDFAVEYILNYLKDNPKYYDFFQKSFCGDELFFQTILFNSNFKNNISFNEDESKMALRYIDWKTGPDYPRTFDNSDFLEIKNSNMIFARKIKSDEILSELEKFFG